LRLSLGVESLIFQAKTRRPNNLTNRPVVQSSWSMNEIGNSLLTAHQACGGGIVSRHLMSDARGVDELSIRERIEQPSGWIVQHLSQRGTQPADGWDTSSLNQEVYESKACQP
jgi:hypothetical protein